MWYLSAAVGLRCNPGRWGQRAQNKLFWDTWSLDTVPPKQKIFSRGETLSQVDRVGLRTAGTTTSQPNRRVRSLETAWSATECMLDVLNGQENLKVLEIPDSTAPGQQCLYTNVFTRTLHTTQAQYTTAVQDNTNTTAQCNMFHITLHTSPQKG